MSEVIYCGVCGKSVFRSSDEPIKVRASVSSRTPTRSSASLLTEMMASADEAYREKIARAELACFEHFQARHPLRLRLWRRLHWTWLMQRRWPWSPVSDAEEFRYRP